MKCHSAIGALSIIASLLPLWMATWIGFHFSPWSWLFLFYAVPGATALAAGALLILGMRLSYIVGIIGWALLVLAAAFSLLDRWQSYAQGSSFSVEALVTEVLYVVVGVTVIIVLRRHRRSATGSHGGGEVAA